MASIRRTFIAFVSLTLMQVAPGAEARPYLIRCKRERACRQQRSAPPSPTEDSAGTLSKIAAKPSPVGGDFNAILKRWEQRGQCIRMASIRFRTWEYDAVGALGSNQPVSEAEGEIGFSTPSSWRYRILNRVLFAPAMEAGGPPQRTMVNGGEYWLSDGKAFYELRQDTKEMVVRDWPPQFVGISKLFFPETLLFRFLFDVDADKLAVEHSIQIVTPPDAPQDERWLELRPREEESRAEYDHVVVILSDESALPKAIEITKPNQTARESYEFIDPKVNELLDKPEDYFRTFLPPKLPMGWKRIDLR